MPLLRSQDYGLTPEEHVSMSGGVFSEYTILRNPLPTRESRCPLPYSDHSRLNGECVKPNTDYSSHQLAIAVQVGAEKRGYYVLCHNGAGREIHKIHSVLAETILDVEDPVRCYIALYGFVDDIGNAETKQATETAMTYRRAFIDGRLKKRKVKQGVKVWINSL